MFKEVVNSTVMTTEGIGTGKKIQEQNSMTSPTKERATKYSGIEVPPICLPKGGGVLGRIHEKFEMDVANGTANLNVPIPVTPGRPVFSPLLASGSRSVGWNHSLEIGWSLNYPIKQKKISICRNVGRSLMSVYSLFLGLKICCHNIRENG